MTRFALRLIPVSMIVALGALAPLAQASPTFEANSYPASVSGSNTKGTEVIATEGGKIECDSSYSGTLAEPSSTLTLHPTYTNCDAFGFLEATVNTEGCNYDLHATQKIKANEYFAHFDLKCSGAITVKVFTCDITIGAQAGVTTARIKNSTGGSLKSIFLIWAGAEIKYKIDTDGLFCPFSGTGERTDATYSGEATEISSANEIFTSGE